MARPKDTIEIPSQDQKRIKLAKLHGFKFHEHCLIGATNFLSGWSHDEYGFVDQVWDLPDYFNDLNATHELAKCVPQNLKPKYFAILCSQVSSLVTLYGYSEVTEAPAFKRAEAIGLTMKLWEN